MIVEGGICILLMPNVVVPQLPTPVFDAKCRYPREFPHIRCHKDQTLRERVAGDRRIMRANWPALLSEDRPVLSSPQPGGAVAKTPYGSEVVTVPRSAS